MSIELDVESDNYVWETKIEKTECCDNIVCACKVRTSRKSKKYNIESSNGGKCITIDYDSYAKLLRDVQILNNRYNKLLQNVQVLQKQVSVLRSKLAHTK